MENMAVYCLLTSDFHTLMVLSVEAVYRRSVPPHFTHCTASAWAVRITWYLPRNVSQILTVVSFKTECNTRVVKSKITTSRKICLELPCQNRMHAHTHTHTHRHTHTHTHTQSHTRAHTHPPAPFCC